MDSNKKKINGRRSLARIAAAAAFAVLLAIGVSPGLRAQTFNDGGTGILGNFSNTLTVTTVSPTDTCNYDTITIDLAQGRIFVHPVLSIANTACGTTALQDVTTAFLPSVIAPPFDGSSGLLDVVNFTLQQSQVGPNTQVVTLKFVPNANNTPVIIRATGLVTINAGQFLSVAGAGGQNRPTAFLRGAGGAGGPGGYAGGSGGNGGLSPSAGAAGQGPGGGVGGLAGTTSCTRPLTGPTFLTTGALGVPSGNDLLYQLRGGAGGGGGGGCTAGAASGGGGGGGAIMIAANTTITVNGALTAQGGINGCSTNGNGAPGTGGVIRLVANTIAGSGTIRADQGPTTDCGGGVPLAADGIVRFEAFTISYTPGGGQTLAGGVAAASAPGLVVTPVESTTTQAFLQFYTLTDVGNPSNVVQAPLPGASTSPPAYPTSTQGIAGRTGNFTNVDATIHPVDSLQRVNVALAAGPTSASSALSGKTVTLVVTPLDPAQGAAAAYTGTVSCTTTCTATISNVVLPLGFSAMNAFTVVNLAANGALSRNFPATMEGEPIESVKLQTSGKDTEYVLISKSGREFPFKPGVAK